MTQVQPFAQQGHWTAVHNVVFDEIMPRVSDGALRILLLVIRRTDGQQKRNCELSYLDMMTGTGLSRASVSRAVRELTGTETWETPILLKRQAEAVGAAPHKHCRFALNRKFKLTLTAFKGAAEAVDDRLKNEPHGFKNEPLESADSFNFEPSDSFNFEPSVSFNERHVFKEHNELSVGESHARTHAQAVAALNESPGTLTARGAAATNNDPKAPRVDRPATRADTPPMPPKPAASIGTYGAPPPAPWPREIEDVAREVCKLGIVIGTRDRAGLIEFAPFVLGECGGDMQRAVEETRRRFCREAWKRRNPPMVSQLLTDWHKQAYALESDAVPPGVAHSGAAAHRYASAADRRAANYEAITAYTRRAAVKAGLIPADAQAVSGL